MKSLDAFGETDEYQRTPQLMAMIRELFPEETSLYTFSASASKSIRSHAWEEISLDLGFRVITGVRDYVDSRGAVAKARDGSHWNGFGHKLAAEVMVPILAQDLNLALHRDLAYSRTQSK